MGGFVGIDESKFNGRYGLNEVIVAAYSEDPAEVRFTNMPKQRRFNPDEIEEVLRSTRFSFAILPQRYCQELLFHDKKRIRYFFTKMNAYNLTRTMIFSELVRRLEIPKGREGGIEQVIIDGEDFKDLNAEKIRRVLRDFGYHTGVACIRRADVRFGVVNTADRIANHIQRIYPHIQGISTHEIHLPQGVYIPQAPRIFDSLGHGHALKAYLSPENIRPAEHK